MVQLTKDQRLAANVSVAFMGDTKGGPFDIAGDQAREWLRLPANPNSRTNADVLKPWVNGMDLACRPAGKWIVDFGWSMSAGAAARGRRPAHLLIKDIKRLPRRRIGSTPCNVMAVEHSEVRGGVMSARTVAAAALVGIVLVGYGWVHAQSGEAVMNLTPADYSEIQHIALSLNQGADFNDSDLWVSQWTLDGSWTHPSGESYVGHDRLREYRRSTRPQGGGSSDRRHWTNGVVVTPTAGGATGRTYYMLLNIAASPPTTVSAGHYEDVFVKTASGWRIKQRIIKQYPLPLLGRPGD